MSTETTETTSETPEAPARMRMLERLYQNGEFQRMREVARQQRTPLNIENENLRNVIDLTPGRAASSDAEVTTPVDPDVEAKNSFAASTSEGIRQLFAATNDLESLSAEHQRSENATSAEWFDGTRSGALSGRQRYQASRKLLGAGLAQMKAACTESGLRQTSSFAREFSRLEKSSQSLIRENGDFPEGHEAIAAFCESLRELLNDVDNFRQEIEAVESESSEPIETDASEGPEITTSANHVAKYREIAKKLQTQLADVTTTAFWKEPALRVGSSDITAVAAELQNEVRNISDDESTANVTVARDVSARLSELTEMMQTQLRMHQNRPAEFTIESGRNKVQKTVSVLRDGFNSRYRNFVLAGAFGLATVGGILYNNSSRGPDNAAETQAAASANPPAGPATNPANSPTSPANAPTVAATQKGTAELGGGRVDVVGDNFVFTFGSSVQAAQAWVGKPGEEPVRLALQVVNGKATFQIPVELKGQNWIGVQLDTFEAGTWKTGVFKKLELK